MKEQKRIARKYEQILNALRQAGKIGVTNAELSKIALRYGGHLGRMYREGYEVDKQFLGDGLYNYTLISEPKEIIKRQNALDKLLAEVDKFGSTGVDTKTLVKLLDSNGIAVKYKANTYKQGEAVE